MDLTISGRHVAVTDAMREHARQRVKKLERYGSHLMRVKVTLSIHGDRHEAEIVGVVRGRGDLVAKCETHDMYLAIDQTTVKMEKQLHKLEERFRDRRESTRHKRPPEDATASETEPS